MSRRAGYRTFEEAYNRLLLASARRLSSSDASSLTAGTHRVIIEAAKWDRGTVAFTFEGTARRRHIERVDRFSKAYNQVCGACGVFPVPPRELIGLRLGIELAPTPDAVDVAIGVGGEVLVLDTQDKIIDTFEDVAEARRRYTDRLGALEIVRVFHVEHSK